ncbi:hypothetical protein CRUP_024041 [Coryphaenoides rupestris]|nr:hypothetical protein CRUP_024041 [Coryphaenoides rupestris]
MMMMMMMAFCCFSPLVPQGSEASHGAFWAEGEGRRHAHQESECVRHAERRQGSEPERVHVARPPAPPPGALADTATLVPGPWPPRPPAPGPRSPVPS